MKTVRVRICVAIKDDGEWCSNGWSGLEDDRAERFSRSDLESGGGARVVFIEADVPLPDPAPPPVIQGSVEPCRFDALVPKEDPDRG